jgi:hypothetical protein
VRPPPIRRAAGALALAAAIAGPAAAGGAARGASDAVGRPFTLASGFQTAYGAGPSVLGPDGTAWLAQPGFGATPASGFEIVARALGGGLAVAVATSDGGGSATDRPVIAARAGCATFVWQTASGFGGSAGVAEVRARSCTLAGCGPIQVLDRWAWDSSGAVGSSGFTAVGDAEPGVAVSGGRVVALFERAGGGRPRMEWASATGGRFGPVHALRAPAGPVAVLAPAAGGGLVGAWIAGSLASFGSGVQWASWSARDGFAAPRALAGADGMDSELAAAPAGRGVALAWLAGAAISDPIPSAPIWVARRGAGGGFSKPVRVGGANAVGLSLAGAPDTLALAFSTTAGPGASSDAPGPAWVRRSVAGGPFGAAVDLDRTAAAHPAVGVAPDGRVLAGWSACGAQAASTAGCSAQLAIAAGRGAFAAPISLGGEDRDDSPQIHVAGARALVVWESGDAVRAVIVTP